MIIVQLKGGLGNQMFQYANGRAIAERLHAPLGLDVFIPEKSLTRPYKLRIFNIHAKIVTPNEIAEVIGVKKTGLYRFIDVLSEFFTPYYRRRFIKERSMNYDANIAKVSDPVYLSGYWQSEKYFIEIDSIIREEFSITQTADPINANMLLQISEGNAISIHIRRGDYITDPVTNRFHGVCPLEYYDRAVRMIGERVDSPHFYVFSDELGWAQENLRIDFPTTFVTQNGVEHDYEDLRLMSHCKHHIIANSSFSWWGAWLCNFQNKIVIAPLDWFIDSARPTADLVPPSWIRI